MEADRPAPGPGPTKQLSIGLIGVRRLGLLAGHALLDVVAGDHPALPPWPTASGGRWNRRAVLVLAAAVLIGGWIFVSSLQRVNPFTLAGLVLIASGVATVVSVLACYRRPMIGFRIMVLTAAVFVLLIPSVDMLSFVLGPTWLGAAPMWLVLAALAALFAVAEQHRLAELGWVWVLTVTALCLRGGSTTLYRPARGWSLVLPTAALIGAVLLVGYVIQLARVANEQRVRRAGEQANTVLLRERGYIARELHDVVAHHMSMLALRADSAPYRFPDLTDEVRAEFAALCATAREGLTEMRRLLGVLRAEDETALTAPQPSLREIKDLVDGLREAGTQVSLSMYVVAEELPRALGLSTYRIVQEALSNAVRHAPGAGVRVDVWTTDAALHIEITNTEGSVADAARGNPDEQPARHGLLGMRERVNMLGGTLSTGATEDGGFTVLAVLPLHDGLGDEA
jgi:signal transduction histidine kinase